MFWCKTDNISSGITYLELHVYDTLVIKSVWPGVRNCKILLLVHGQVNGHNPLVQPRFTSPKIDIFSYFSKKTYVLGTH